MSTRLLLLADTHIPGRARALPDAVRRAADDADLVIDKWSIALEDVRFFYQMRPQQQVLQGMSLRIEEGQVGAQVGKSGGGKSTIIHLLLRFYDPREGRITIGNVDRSSGSVRSGLFTILATEVP